MGDDFFHFEKISIFEIKHYTIDLKRQSEHSGLRPDTSRLVSFVERNANSTIEQQKCKGREELLTTKMDFHVQFSHRCFFSVF